MKKSEKRFILLLIIVGIIIITILVKVKGGKNAGESSNGEGTNADIPTEEFVQVLDDGTKLNVSEKLTETKKVGNYEISNIQLTEQNGQSLILADVKNVGETKAEVTLIDIIILDKDGNEINVIGGIIGDVEPGASVQLNASATADFANAYDFEVRIPEQQ